MANDTNDASTRARGSSGFISGVSSGFSTGKSRNIGIDGSRWVAWGDSVKANSEDQCSWIYCNRIYPDMSSAC